MVADKFKSSVQLVRVLPKVNQNLLKKVFGLLEQMLLLWRRDSKFLKEDTVLMV